MKSQKTQDDSLMLTLIDRYEEAKLNCVDVVQMHSRWLCGAPPSAVAKALADATRLVEGPKRRCAAGCGIVHPRPLHTLAAKDNPAVCS